MRQCELAPGLSWNDVNTHLGLLTRVLWNGECEDQTAGPYDIEILAAMLDVLSIAPIDKDEFASDPWIDLNPHYLARGGGKQPSACSLWI
jgi:hypothetical protein